MFNNCKYDYAPRNARDMAEILGDVAAPRLPGSEQTGPHAAESTVAEDEGFSGTLF